MKAHEWIDRVKAVKGIESDYGVAKFLQMTPQAVSGYRSKTPTMNEETAIKVAEALGLDPAGVLIDQFAEQAKNPQARSALFDVAQGFSRQISAQSNIMLNNSSNFDQMKRF